MRVSALAAVGALGLSHENITKAEWDSESVGKKVFLDMFAAW